MAGQIEPEIQKLLDQIETNKENIYILSGVFGGVLLVLIVLCIVFLVQNNKLKFQIRKLQQDIPWAKGPPAQVQPGMPRAYSQAGSVYGTQYGEAPPRYN